MSPLLANIYVDDIDKIMYFETKRYIRYADDIICISKTKNISESRILRLNLLLEDLYLSLNLTKTEICHLKDGVEFLGFRIYPDKIMISPISLKKYQRRLTKIANAKNGNSKRKI